MPQVNLSVEVAVFIKVITEDATHRKDENPSLKDLLIHLLRLLGVEISTFTVVHNARDLDKEGVSTL